MEKLVIKKRVSEEMACWKVPCEGIYPNTVVEADPGLTILVNVDGQNKLTTKRSFTVHSLLNPGQNTKFIGGKKPYARCEIFAIDISTEFKSEWGLAGPTALPCYDSEFGVEAKAVCFGEYFYNIDDFFSFVRWLPMGDREQISRDDVREYLRSQTAGIAQSHLNAVLANRDIKVCQSKLGEIAEAIRGELNKKFDSKGLTVHSFIVSNLEYEPAHKANREILKAAKVNVKLKEIVNEGRRDDISVEKDQSEVDIAYINAYNNVHSEKEKKESKAEDAAAKIYCPRCGEANNANVNYCFKCGEALRKKN